MSTGEEIGKFIDDMKKAEAALEDARQAVSAARTKEAECLADVDEAQKQIDKMISSLKDASPMATAWDRSVNIGFKLPS